MSPCSGARGLAAAGRTSCGRSRRSGRAKLWTGRRNRGVVGVNGPSEIITKGKLKGFAQQLFASHRTGGVGLIVVPPCLIPWPPPCPFVDSEVNLLGDEHRPLMDVDAVRAKPCCEPRLLRKEVVLDQPSFKPRKSREKALTVAEVKRHPGLGVLPKASAAPVAVSARGPKRQANATGWVHMAPPRRTRYRIGGQVFATEDTTPPFITCQQDTLISLRLITP
ncbi:hypothetical protein SAMN05443639_10627 [Stigmatella erecta]|uniref:Uncharacterized protein n=1 Tax=Stigmatella erecta TaxID=83460 RepID=A0A1I0IH14_9BACT|nr:hypothetical protein SAMN05443639_10627 [Stigmatella erecta]